MECPVEPNPPRLTDDETEPCDDDDDLPLHALLTPPAGAPDLGVALAPVPTVPPIGGVT